MANALTENQKTIDNKTASLKPSLYDVLTQNLKSGSIYSGYGQTIFVNPKGEVVTNPDEINNLMKQFYGEGGEPGKRVLPQGYRGFSVFENEGIFDSLFHGKPLHRRFQDIQSGESLLPK